MGWGSDGDEWETTSHHWLHVWIDEGMTGRQLYDGFRRAGAPCTDGRVVREPSVEEQQGIAALAFRQVATLVIRHCFHVSVFVCVQGLPYACIISLPDQPANVSS